MDESIYKKLTALSELAKRGERGEAKQAKKMLLKFMERHGITDDMLVDDERLIEVTFSVKNNNEFSLLMQCAGTVLNTHTVAYTRITIRKVVKYRFELPAAQAAELGTLYNFYVSRFRIELKKLREKHERELELYTSAFIQANKIVPTNKNTEEQAKKITKDDLRLIMRMADDIEAIPFKKAIE